MENYTGNGVGDVMDHSGGLSKKRMLNTSLV